MFSLSPASCASLLNNPYDHGLHELHGYRMAVFSYPRPSAPALSFVGRSAVNHPDHRGFRQKTRIKSQSFKRR